MAEPARCPHCKHELPVNAPQGLCPMCLLAQAMESEPLSSPRSGNPEVKARSGNGLSHGSVLEALRNSIGEVPSILLRDTETEPDPPVVRPWSTEMPADRGRYHVLGEIDSGGQGAIFKGRDPDLGRDLVLKVLLEKYHDDPAMTRQFVEEAQISGQLQHPGIVPVYELGSFADRRPYFTMKLVKGRDLAALLKDRASPGQDLSRFLGIFEHVCQTMAYAHARGVIHRDLKPKNIMVGSFGEVQVMDWGLAKVLPRGESVAESHPLQDQAALSVIRTFPTGSAVHEAQARSVWGGTPAYMAPEQADVRIKAVNEQADVFALGSILCEILTGRPAYAGASSEAIMRQAIRGETAAALSRLDNCGLDGELVALARDCLAADPAERPRGAGEVAKRITAYLAGVQERLRAAELGRAAGEARAKEAEATAAAAQAKAAAERRARRLIAALAATVLLAGAGWGWNEHQRLERVREVSGRVNVALQDATRLRGQAQRAAVGDLAPWDLAAVAAEKARDELEPGVEPAVREQVENLVAELAVERQRAEAAAGAAERDRRLLDRLVDIRSAEADDRGGWSTDSAYADAFREAGLDVAALSAAEAAQRVRARPPEVVTKLAAAVDDWAAIRRDRKQNRAGAAALSALAGAADPDTWRVDLRRALDLPDQAARREALQRLAKATPAETLGPISLDLLGRALKDAGDPTGAEAVLRPAQQRHPGDVWINYDLARALEKLARRDDAIPYYTAARAIRPETAHELAHLLEAKGERNEGIAILEDLRRRRPDSGRHLGCLGRALLNQGRSDQARAVLAAAETANREAVRKRPDDASAHFSLGVALHIQGKLDQARDEYSTAIRLQPDNAAVHDNLSELLGKQGKVDEAIAEHRIAIRLQPDFANAFNTLGYILIVKQDFAAAAAEFRKAIHLQPDFANAHSNLGLALQQQGELEKAIAEYHIAIRLKPDFADPHMGLGEIFESQGKLDEAIVAYRTASRIQPSSADAHNSFAWAVVKKPNRGAQERSEALEHARQAVAINPKDGACHATLALAEYRAGHWAESIAAAEQSIALTKDEDASNGFFLAMALWQQGAKDRSRSIFDQAVAWTRKNDPKDANLLLFWREAAELLGQPGPDALPADLPANPFAP